MSLESDIKNRTLTTSPNCHWEDGLFLKGDCYFCDRCGVTILGNGGIEYHDSEDSQ